MNLTLAPLAGFTDAPFRKVAHRFGAAKTYTEMLSAAALARGHEATKVIFEVLPDEGPVACQIFGANVDDVSRAVAALPHSRFCEINLNAGCPMTKVTRSGSGAKLMESPVQVYALLKAMKDNCPLPVTLKTRLGPAPGNDTVFELLDAAQSAGAEALIVHARYASQMHGGPVNLELLRDVVAKAKIPVFGNGSITGRASLDAMLATGVAGVMIGRAALADPAIFCSLGDGIRQECEPLSRIETFNMHMGYIIDFHAQLVQNLKTCRLPDLDSFAALKARTHLFRYFSGLPGACALRARFNSVRSLADIYSIVKDVKSTLGGGAQQ